MTLHLVPSTTRHDNHDPHDGGERPPGRTYTVTDTTSGLTVRFDGFAGGALLFEIDACCCHDSDEFRGAAMLQLAVAGDTPIHWLVPHRACAARIEQVLRGQDGGRIMVCVPPAAA